MVGGVRDGAMSHRLSTRSTMKTSPPPSSSTALVLGAGGRFGQAAVTAFAAQGWRVIAQARHPVSYPLPANTSTTTASLDAPAELAAAAAGAAAVVYAVNMPYPEWPRRALATLRLGIETALRLEARLLLPGNVYNFGAAMPPTLGESTAQAPTTRFGELRVQMEDELQLRGELRSTVIRAGDFFGSGAGNWFDQVIVKSLRKRKLVYPGPLDRAHAWAYLPDLAQTFAIVAGRGDQPRFSRWHFPGYTATGREWLDALEEAAVGLGVGAAGSFSRGSLPWPIIRAMGLVMPTWRAIAELSYLWRVPHQLDGAALARWLGPLPQTPLPEALRHALVELGHRPHLAMAAAS
jgi:nucleoside-diphosphate-sugar epimerase